ncbi:MAG: CRTAC1 family protein, partial [Bacteroidetes bacterium]
AEHPTPTPPADDAPYAPPPDALFELLPPESTGIDFVNNIIESHRMNIVTNSYMYNGGGVAVLDVNNDSLPDLYFTSSQESNRLYLNKGGFRFEDITESSGTGADGFKTGVTVVDINADGWQDLYVCRSGIDLSPEGLARRANLLFVNNGDGTFTERAAEYGLNDASASNHANFFDYDRDGDLDAYILNHPITFHEVNKVNVRQEGTRYVRNTAPRDQWESDKLFRNNGDGTFTDVSQEAGIQNRAFGLSVTVSDFNHDGWPDIFVGNDYIEPDLLYLNNQDGTFRIATDDFFRHTSNHTMGVDIADFNNDALVDLVALDMIAEDNRRQKELMTTMLLDRYLTLVKFGYGHQLMRNTLQLNNGRDFSEIGTLAGISNTDWSWAVLLLDFDNDARKDLFITNGYRRDVTNLDYLNYTVDSINRMGGLSPQTFPDINDYLRLIPAEKLPNYLFRNRGDLRFENVSRSWGIAHPSWSNGAAWADLDADGDPELIVNNIHQAAFVFRNRAVEQGRGHWLQIRLEGRKPNPAGIGARVRIQTADSLQYQELSPVRGFFSSVEHLLHFGLGEATRVDRLEVQWPDGSVQVLENLPADRRITLRQTDARPTSLPPEPAPEPLFEGASPPGLEFVHREN